MKLRARQGGAVSGYVRITSAKVAKVAGETVEGVRDVLIGEELVLE